MKYTTAILSTLIIVAFFLGRYTKPTEIKVVEKIVYETKWKVKVDQEFNQENFQKLLGCFNSNINFDSHTEQDNLYVKAYDDCKEAEVKFKISTKSNWNYYIGFGAVGAIAGGYVVYRLIK